jgi:hypothetical protein
MQLCVVGQSKTKGEEKLPVVVKAKVKMDDLKDKEKQHDQPRPQH